MFYISIIFLRFWTFCGIAKGQELFQKCLQHSKISISSVHYYTNPPHYQHSCAVSGKSYCPVRWRSWITVEIADFVKVNSESETEIEPTVFYSQVLWPFYTPFLCLLLPLICLRPCSLWTPFEDLDNTST